MHNSKSSPGDSNVHPRMDALGQGFPMYGPWTRDRGITMGTSKNTNY